MLQPFSCIFHATGCAGVCATARVHCLALIYENHSNFQPCFVVRVYQFNCCLFWEGVTDCSCVWEPCQNRESNPGFRHSVSHSCHGQGREFSSVLDGLLQKFDPRQVRTVQPTCRVCLSTQHRTRTRYWVLNKARTKRNANYHLDLEMRLGSVDASTRSVGLATNLF